MTQPLPARGQADGNSTCSLSSSAILTLKFIIIPPMSPDPNPGTVNHQQCGSMSTRRTAMAKDLLATCQGQIEVHNKCWLIFHI